MSGQIAGAIHGPFARLGTHLCALATTMVLAAMAMIVAGCDRSAATSPAATSSTTPAPTQREGPLRVVATTGMIGDAARAIGGDRVTVTTLMGPGVDPHTYKATARDVRTLQEADIILYNGLHLEGRMADVLVNLARTRATVRVTDSIPEDRLREPPEFEGHVDPHVWFDPALWAFVAERTRDALIEVDPAGRDAYTAAAAAYTAQLTTLRTWMLEQVATIPPDRRILVTAHDAFGYLGAATGLRVLALQGISTESEISIQGVNELVDTLVNDRIPAVFVESTVPRKSVESLVAGAAARGHTLVIGGELFSDAMGPDNTPEGTYVGMVRHNVSTIVAALAHSTTTPATTPTPAPTTTPAPAPAP
jgi:manganese/zinc/iron transport system substrate-binding protein